MYPNEKPEQYRDRVRYSEEENKRIWREVGMLTLYNRLLTMRAFQVPGKNPMHCIRHGSAFEAFAMLSVQNSMRT